MYTKVKTGSLNPYVYNISSLWYRCCRDRDRMVVGFTTTCAISSYHH